MKELSKQDLLNMTWDYNCLRPAKMVVGIYNGVEVRRDSFALIDSEYEICVTRANLSVGWSEIIIYEDLEYDIESKKWEGNNADHGKPHKIDDFGNVITEILKYEGRLSIFNAETGNTICTISNLK